MPCVWLPGSARQEHTLDEAADRWASPKTSPARCSPRQCGRSAGPGRSLLSDRATNPQYVPDSRNDLGDHSAWLHGSGGKGREPVGLPGRADVAAARPPGGIFVATPPLSPQAKGREASCVTCRCLGSTLAGQSRILLHNGGNGRSSGDRRDGGLGVEVLGRCGEDGTRTRNPRLAKAVRYQLRHFPAPDNRAGEAYLPSRSIAPRRREASSCADTLYGPRVSWPFEERGPRPGPSAYPGRHVVQAADRRLCTTAPTRAGEASQSCAYAEARRPVRR